MSVPNSCIAAFSILLARGLVKGGKIVRGGSPMVDRRARREYAQLVRQFISGRMTNSGYEQRFFGLRANEKDAALVEIFDEVNTLCEDAYPNKLTQRWQLNNDERRRVAQAVLFLHSGAEYQWLDKLWDGSVFLITAFFVLLLFALLPKTSLLIRFAVSVPLVAAWQWYERWQFKRSVIVGDKEAWPFLHQAELEAARRQPRLLNGKGNNVA